MSPRYPGGPRPPLRLPNQVKATLTTAVIKQNRRNEQCLGDIDDDAHAFLCSPLQGLGGVPGSQAMLTSGMDPTRQQGTH